MGVGALVASKVGSKGEKLALIHTFVKHLPRPKVPTGPIRLTGQSQNVLKGLSI